jgi:hypothetical protein
MQTQHMKTSKNACADREAERTRGVNIAAPKRIQAHKSSIAEATAVRLFFIIEVFIFF